MLLHTHNIIGVKIHIRIVTAAGKAGYFFIAGKIKGAAVTKNQSVSSVSHGGVRCHHSRFPRVAVV